MRCGSGTAQPPRKRVRPLSSRKYPDQDETRLVERVRRVAEYLQSTFAMPVKYLPVKSYRAAITAFINGKPMPTRLSEAPGEVGIGRRLGVERLPCKA